MTGAILVEGLESSARAADDIFNEQIALVAFTTYKTSTHLDAHYIPPYSTLPYPITHRCIQNQRTYALRDRNGDVHVHA